MNSGSIYALQSVCLNSLANGDNTVVTGMDGKVIRVHSIDLQNSDGTSQVIAIIKDSDGTVLDGIVCPVNGGGKVSVSPTPEFPKYQCGVGKDLMINLSADVDVYGNLTYSVA